MYMKINSVGEFDASTCSGDNFYDTFEIEEKELLKIQLFGSELIIFWEVGSLKSLSVIC